MITVFIAFQLTALILLMQGAQLYIPVFDSDTTSVDDLIVRYRFQSLSTINKAIF